MASGHPSHSTWHASQDRFATSRWSQVMRRDTPNAGARDALAELSARYRYPVYAYLRRSGHAPAHVLLLTEHFLAELTAEVPQGSAAPAPGQFRAFLLLRLHAFLIKPSTMDAPGSPSIGGDELELRYLADRLGAITPEQAFHLCYARELLQRARAQLAKEASQAGRDALYAALEPYLALDPEPGRLGLIANAQNASAALVSIAHKRLRQRFRELVDEELIETVGGAADLAREREALFAALSAQNA